VRVGFVGGLPLAPMAHRAAEFGWIVNYRLVRGKDLCTPDTLLARSHGDVAGNAAVARVQRRVDDLPELDRYRSFLCLPGGLDDAPLAAATLLVCRAYEQRQDAYAGT